MCVLDVGERTGRGGGHNTRRTSTALMPTSITAAPSLIQLPLTISGRPHAAITTSACRQMSAALGVREWMTVTVASSLISSSAAGMPTMLERPTTTAFLPASGTPLRLSSSMQPYAVWWAAVCVCVSACVCARCVDE